MGYTKLFSEIIMSTVWREPDHVRLVWITMLAISDRWHVVSASIPGLADAARVTVDECQRAIERLSSPDKFSRTKDFDGRRIGPCDGGWLILNGEKYRNKMSMDERREYKRIKQKQYRAGAKGVESCGQNGPQLTHTDTDTDKEKIYVEPRSGSRAKVVEVFEHWQKALDHPSAKLSDERARLIAKWLKTYCVRDLCRAIDGCAKTPHNMGDNDRHQRYDGLGVILRNADNIDRFMANSEKTKAGGRPIA